MTNRATERTFSSAQARSRASAAFSTSTKVLTDVDHAGWAVSIGPAGPGMAMSSAGSQATDRLEDSRKDGISEQPDHHGQQDDDDWLDEGGDPGNAHR